MSYVINPLVGWLFAHAYGQGGTVAVPSSEQPVLQAPKGEFPAGIDDVLAYLESQYLAWAPGSTSGVDWCFLVGGPGNGKSESLRSLATRLGVTLPARVVGDPVPRVVPTSWPTAAQPLQSGLEIAFINDASIPRKDAQGAGLPGSLFRDIDDAFKRVTASNKPVALFGNINRGILIEETGCLSAGHASLSTAEGVVAGDLVRWLARPPGEKGQWGNSGSIETVVAVDPYSPHYGQCVVTLQGNKRLVVHAIFLDVLSLLEPRPGAGGPVVDFSVSPPLVANYQTLGTLLSTDVSRDETTAGRLVRDFAAEARWDGGGCRDVNGTLCAAHGTCPFAQNARWLRGDSLRHRFLDTLRAAEVAAARRFTYRDLLGHVSLAIIGQPEEEWLERKHPCDWSREQHLVVTSADPAARKKAAVVALQSHRLYANLFGNVIVDAKRFSERELVGDTVYGAIKTRRESSGESPRVQAFERAFQDIDPSRDTDAWGGARGRALDLVESLDVQLPSEQLATWSSFPADALSEIEILMDRALRDEISTELERGSRAAGSRARALRRWRSMLMLRQVGLTLGHLGFGAAIQAWLAEQENALRGGQRMKLGDGIHNLVIPPGRTGHVFLAPFRPRTYCISELPAQTMLVSVATTDLVLAIVSHGDTLVAEVQMNRIREKKPPQLLASLVIDLAVAREAVLHQEGDSRSFTEIGYTAFARIERARASLISRERMRTLPVHFTDRTEQLYRVSPNPGGPVPLRVQKV